jgi:uncharacterized RDD family membrane protein YckC
VTDLATAGLWRRGAAAVIDATLGLLVWVWSALCVLIAVWGFRTAPLDLADAALLLAAIGLLGVVLHFVYHVAFVGGCGQTPGRMATGITVIRRDGRSVGYVRALVRCVGGCLSLLTLGFASVGLFVSRERRGLADWLAGTRVVRA